MIEKKQNNGVWKYYWTAGGMLKAVQRPDGLIIRFSYDAFGRRIEKKTARATTHFVWDGNVPLHEWKTFDYRETTDNERITWVFQDFVPVAKLQGDKSYSIISDHIGTPLVAIDTQGNKVWERELDIYGKVRKLQGDKWFMPFLYQGQYYDVETELAYNRFRYYDPNSGNYISQDPIGLAGNNPNIYAYVWDTNTWIDIFGLLDLFHGTTIEGANSIRQNGVDLSKGKLNLDFNTQGKGAFYTSDSYKDTINYNKYKSKKMKNSPMEILKLEIPDVELVNLKIKTFDSDNVEWADFVKKSRLGENIHDYDIVIGPKLANPNKLTNPISIPNSKQIVITSEKAANLIKCKS